MDTITIGGHAFHKSEPTLKCIESAIQKVLTNNGKAPDIEHTASALSIILTGDDTYKRQLMEVDETELYPTFSSLFVEQVKKLCKTLSYIKAIESLAAREK